MSIQNKAAQQKNRQRQCVEQAALAPGQSPQVWQSGRGRNRARFLTISIICAFTPVQCPIMSFLPPLGSWGACLTLFFYKSLKALSLNYRKIIYQGIWEQHTLGSLLSLQAHSLSFGTEQMTVRDSPICLPQEGKLVLGDARRFKTPTTGYPLSPPQP